MDYINGMEIIPLMNVDIDDSYLKLNLFNTIYR